MNAKYGKISIGCFIAFPLVVVFFVLLSNFLHAGDGSPLFALAFLTYYLCIILGIVYGVVGIVKKESPKYFSIIGLLLNLGLVLLFAIMAACF